MTLSNNIAVIGGGAWGCALADILAQNHQEVTLLSARADFVELFNKEHITQSFPNEVLTKNIFATNDFSILAKSKIIFIVCDAAHIEDNIAKINAIINKEAILILCSKGFSEDGEIFSKILQNKFPENKLAILSGPNFAIEIIQKKLACTTIASNDLGIAQEISKIIKTKYFYPKISQDIITTQIAAIIKNIVAICCGLVDGLNLGVNCKAALINKGLEEIFYISEAMGGNPKEDILSPAVFGDLFLTCSSSKSRNYSYGFNVASKNDAKNQLQTCEGVRASQILPKFLAKYNINANKLQLCLMVKDIIGNNINIANLEDKISDIINYTNSIK